MAVSSAPVTMAAKKKSAPRATRVVPAKPNEWDRPERDSSPTYKLRAAQATEFCKCGAPATITYTREGKVSKFCLSCYTG